MPIRVLVATHNRGKLREYANLLTDLVVEWVLLTDLGIDAKVDETGATFEANARLKAATYAHLSGLLTLADDSGLEVDALGGGPGVQSARYAGVGASDSDRYRKLLHELEGVPVAKRGARFVCAVAVSTPEGEMTTVRGTCEGRIAYGPRGAHGFGYDPVFYIPELRMTMAEIGPDIKNRISHRARAVAAIKPVLERLIAKSSK